MNAQENQIRAEICHKTACETENVGHVFLLWSRKCALILFLCGQQRLPLNFQLFDVLWMSSNQVHISGRMLGAFIPLRDTKLYFSKSADSRTVKNLKVIKVPQESYLSNYIRFVVLQSSEFNHLKILLRTTTNRI